jgi:uncharacterized protein (TIGR02246 family)
MSDRDAVAQLIAAAEENQSDVDGFLALHHPDVVIVNLAGRRVLGRDELRRAMTAALDSPLAKVLTRIEVADVRFPAPDVALVSARKHVSDQRDTDTDTDADALPSTAEMTYTAVRTDIGWRIALAQTTPIRTA